MASSVEYIEYVCEQIKGVGILRYKKCLVNIWYMLMINQFY